ncbi:MAG: chromosomal replication initiator protein DnaA [Oscillospiraceae bacterium]|nr:chromosomal replication initiator protein DnaA [Oscillospiraceae bacterium]
MDTPGSLTQAFDIVKQRIAGQLSDIAYSLWVKDIEILKFEGSTAFLLVKSKFKKDILDEKYIPMLNEAFSHVMGFDVSVDVDFSEVDSSPEDARPPASGGIDDEYTFSSFVVGNSNKFAHAASLAVSANPADAYNPLFIYGSSGLGKTHLLFAIGSEMKKSNPNLNIVTVGGEDFTNELIDSINKAATQKFRDKYRQADVLMLDDVQFIGGRDSTQEEFFHTFNTLYHNNKQIVITSDRPPKEIKLLEERLRTRFEWGLLADIQPPDYETRIAILKRKAEQLNYEIPMEVCEYIANRLKNDIRQLEGTVKKMNAQLIMDNEPPSMKSAQFAIKDILNDSQPVPVTVERIIAEIGRTFGIPPEDIRSSKRSSNISNARQIAAYVVREITQLSTSAIGEEFGGRDHSTIVYALHEVERKIKKNAHYREIVEDILKNIRKN